LLFLGGFAGLLTGKPKNRHPRRHFPRSDEPRQSEGRVRANPMVFSHPGLEDAAISSIFQGFLVFRLEVLRVIFARLHFIIPQDEAMGGA